MDPELHQKATEAIQAAGNMAEELEDEIERQKTISRAKDDLINSLEEENYELTSGLKDAYEKMDFLELGLTQLREEANCARRDFTGLQLAVSLLIFVYGIIYGKYLCN